MPMARPVATQAPLMNVSRRRTSNDGTKLGALEAGCGGRIRPLVSCGGPYGCAMIQDRDRLCC
jgi:hypothetical protein